MTPFKKLNILIVTLSDRAYKGEYEDLSGKALHKIVTDHFAKTSWIVEIQNKLIADDAATLETIIRKAIEQETDIIFTTGGTGIGPRDITPEVISAIIEKEIPGVMDMIRIKYGSSKPTALLSRAIAGTSRKTIIYAIPGSLRAVNEYTTEILLTLEHSIFMLHGIDIHQAI